MGLGPQSTQPRPPESPLVGKADRDETGRGGGDMRSRYAR